MKNYIGVVRVERKLFSFRIFAFKNIKNEFLPNTEKIAGISVKELI
jgi:hypothetical protein